MTIQLSLHPLQSSGFRIVQKNCAVRKERANRSPIRAAEKLLAHPSHHVRLDFTALPQARRLATAYWA
jgi:hypothetical protein